MDNYQDITSFFYWELQERSLVEKEIQIDYLYNKEIKIETVLEEEF